MIARLRASAPALLLGLAVLGWYLFTLAPSLVWADGGRLQIDAVTGASLYWQLDELAGIHTDGLPFDRLGVTAWDHPLWVMLGHALVSLHVGDPARVLNLLSAVPAALAVVVIFLVIRRVGADSWGAAGGAVALAVSQVYWFHAVTAEVYALHSLFMALLIWLALDPAPLTASRLGGLGLLAGLGLANHIMLALTVVPVAVFLAVRHARRPGRGAAAGAGLLFALGWAPWWVQFVRMARVAGFDTTVGVAAGFPWLGHRWPGPIGLGLLGDVTRYLGILVYQFTPVGCAAGVYGAVRLWQRQRAVAVLLLTLFALHAGFSVPYQVADRFAFHLPSFVIFAIFAGYGASEALRRLRSWNRLRPAGARLAPARLAGALMIALLAAPVAIYAAVPAVLRARGLTDADVGIPGVGVDGRDGMEYFLDPNQRGDDSAARFGRQALQELPANALVLTAWPDDLEAYLAMRYYQLTQHLRPDVTLDLMLFTGAQVPDSILAIGAAQQACRPVYLGSAHDAANPASVAPRQFTIIAEAHLYRLLPLHEADGPCPPRAPTPATLRDLLRSARR